MLRPLAFVLASTVALGQAPPATGSFDLHVTTITGEPVPGASVTLQGPESANHSGVTAADGHLLLSDLPPGTYKFQAFDAPGYLRDSRNFLSEVSVHAGNTRAYSFQLRRAPRIQGTVTDDAGNPIEGTTVVVGGAAMMMPMTESAVRYQATTDSQGRYFITAIVPPESFLLPFNLPPFASLAIKAYVPRERMLQTGRAYYPSVRPSEEGLRVSPRPEAIVTADLVLRPTPAYRVRGRVADVPAGTQAAVRISDCGAPNDDGGWHIRTEVQSDGAFDTPMIPPGFYCVTAEFTNPATQAVQYSRMQMVKVVDNDIDQVALSAATPQ